MAVANTRLPVFRHAAAYLFLAAGAAGLALPFLPGIPLLLVGLKLLGPNHPITRGAILLFRRIRSRMSRTASS